MEQKKENSHIARIRRYQSVFGNKEGQMVLTDLIKAHHVLQPTYVRGDTHESAFKEGERNVVLRIFSMMKIDPNKLKEEIDRLVKENENG